LGATELAELCAAYGVEPGAHELRDEVTRRLTAWLLAGDRPYDLGALDAHRTALQD